MPGEAGDVLLVGSSGKAEPAVPIELRQVMVGEAREMQHQDIPLETLRNTTMNTLMREVIKLHDENGWTPDLETAEALVCRWTQWIREFQRDPQYYGDAGEFIKNTPSLPWPDKCKYSKGLEISDHEGTWFEDEYSEYATLLEGSKTFGTVYVTDPSDVRDDYQRVIQTVIEGLNIEDKVQLSGYILRNDEVFNKVLGGDYVYLWDLHNLALRSVDFTDPKVLEMANNCGMGDSLVQIYSAGDNEFYDLRNVLKMYKLDRLLYEAIATDKYSDEQIRLTMGARMSRNGEGREINALREFLLDEKHESPERRKRIEDLVRKIMGLTEDKPVAKSLIEFYSSLKFEDYALSKAVESYRPVWLSRLFDKYKIPEDAALSDWACGTGWLTSGLRRIGYKQARGMDINEAHIQKARELYPDDRDAFSVGDFTAPDVPADSQDVIFIMGRTTHHLDRLELHSLLDQAKHCAKPGGLIIFDRGDPSVGTYRTFLSKFRRVMHGFGYTFRQLSELYHTVDSPDGIHFMDRDVSRESELLEIILREHLIPEVYYENNFNGKDDRNIVFVCRKPKTESKDLGWSRDKEEKIIAKLPRHDASEIYSFTPPTKA